MRRGESERTPVQEADFRELLARVQELQPLPAVALRLMAMAEDRRFSAQDLAETVRVDQALTLKVLRLSNSAFFGLPRRITSIREAIVLLGFREVRGLALSACVLDPLVRDALDHAGIDYDVFWKNSMVVAYFAQVLAVVEHVDQDEAFTAGLVHNIGRLAMAQHRPEQLKAATLEARSTHATIHEVQRANLGYTDAELGAAIADSWAFPLPLVEAIAHHHRPPSELPDRRALDALVVRARRFARAQGVCDGLEQIKTKPIADIEWRAPEAERALKRFGGIWGVLDRADEFLGVARDPGGARRTA
ncbi:MAG: HDOD domain-containing protein [Dehalococcoidia bacterium]